MIGLSVLSATADQLPGLHGRNDNRVYAVIVKRGPEQIQLFRAVVRQGRKLNVNRYIRVFAGAGFRASHDVLKMLARVLDDHRYMMGIAGAGQAAGAQSCRAGKACQCCRNHSPVHGVSPRSLFCRELLLLFS